jgi:hypothetical protein
MTTITVELPQPLVAMCVKVVKHANLVHVNVHPDSLEITITVELAVTPVLEVKHANLVHVNVHPDSLEITIGQSLVNGQCQSACGGIPGLHLVVTVV